MRNKRYDIAHIRLKLFNKLQFLCKHMRRLIRTSHHKAAADPKADILQLSKAAHSAVKGHSPRIQPFKMFFIRGNMMQGIPACSCIIHLFIFTADIFSEGERYGTIGKAPTNIRYDIASLICRKHPIVTLKNKGANPPFISVITTAEYLFLCKPISFAVFIGTTYVAVTTVAETTAACFNQAFDVYLVSVYFFSGFRGVLGSVVNQFECFNRGQAFIFFNGKSVFPFQLIQEPQATSLLFP